jgi:hypothetical protein
VQARRGGSSGRRASGKWEVAAPGHIPRWPEGCRLYNSNLDTCIYLGPLVLGFRCIIEFNALDLSYDPQHRYCDFAIFHRRRQREVPQLVQEE